MKILCMSIPSGWCTAKAAGAPARLFVRSNYDFDAPILRSTVGGAVVGHGLARAQAFRGHLVRRQPARHQMVTHRLRTLERQPLVVAGVAARVRIALHDNRLETLALERRGDLVELVFGDRQQT